MASYDTLDDTYYLWLPVDIYHFFNIPFSLNIYQKSLSLTQRGGSRKEADLALPVCHGRFTMAAALSGPIRR